MADSGIAGAEVSPSFVFDEESKTLTFRRVDTLHVENAITVHAGDIHHHVSESFQDEEMQVDAYPEPINEAGAIEVDPMILQHLQKVFSDCHNPEKWRHNRELCLKLVSLFQDQGNAALKKVRSGSVHFFVSVKLGPDQDAFLRACTDGTLSRGLTKLLVTPELEKAAGVKLRVRLDVKATSTTIKVSAPAEQQASHAPPALTVQGASSKSYPGEEGHDEGMLSLTDLKLDEIGEALGVNENLMTLGLYLDFPRSKVEMFLATNRADGSVSSKGTKNMLYAWRNTTSSTDKVRELRDALVKSNLRFVADDHLPNSTTNQAEPVTRGRGTGISQNVSQEQLDKISQAFPIENFESFSKKLGVGANQANNILVKHSEDYRKALMEILMAWKNRTCGPCSELEEALSASGAKDLIADILYDAR